MLFKFYNSAYVNKPEILVAFMLGLYNSSVSAVSIVTTSLSTQRLFWYLICQT